VQGEKDISYVRAIMKECRDKHKFTIWGVHWYEVPKMRNRDGHKETKGKKASVLFLPKLSL